MTRIICAALLTAIGFPVVAQEAVGELALVLNGETRNFTVVQGGDGANPGSRYSRIGEDVSLTLVAVSGDSPVPPEDAAERFELRFTVTETGSEVRAGSIVSYSTKDPEGLNLNRGGTAEISIDEVTATEHTVAASGSFTSEFPPDAFADATTVEGSFDVTMQSRETVQP